MSREDYEWYKSHHICVYCHQQDAIKGQVLCPDCRDKWTERNRIRNAKKRKQETPEQRERRLQRMKERRLRLIEQGLCVSCGKRKALPGIRHCMECNIKCIKASRRRKKPISIQQRKEHGICLRCNDKAVEGRSLCAKHLEIAQDRCKKAQRAKK